MSNLAFPPCLRPGCKSPSGHPNCRCYSNIPTEHLEQAGYQRPGSTLGLKRQTNPDTGKSWYSGPTNGVEWDGSTTPNTAQSRGRSLASKFIQAGQWAAQTLGKIGGAYFAEGGEVNDLVGEHHNPDCHHYRDGGEVDAYNGMLSNPELSLDHAVIAHGLLHLLTKTGHTKSEDPARVMNDHLDASLRGKKELENHSKNLFETKKENQINSDPNKVSELRAHLEELRANPTKALDVGGDLGSALPGHAGALGAKTAAIMNHMEAIRPKSQQLNPISEPIPPSRSDESHYNRQLAITENPALVYQGIKDGMLQPDDLNTVKSVYPKLYEEMKNQTTAALIDAKSNNQRVSYKHKQGLGSLLGQPLDYTQSPAAMQAIIQANRTQPSPQPEMDKSKKTGATKAVIEQINKVDALSATPIQESQLDQKS